MKRGWKKFFGSTEEVISMFLGLVIVAIMAGLIFNYFQHKRGSIDIPGISDKKSIDLGELKITSKVTPAVTNEEKKVEEIKNNDSYVVKKGDNLWKIAQLNYNSGYKWVDIAKANKIKIPGKITVGQKLVIPSVIPKTSTVIAGKGETKIEMGNYIVVKGDSLWKIAVRSYSDGYQWTKIWKNNRTVLKSPDRLEIGMRLAIPGI